MKIWKPILIVALVATAMIARAPTSWAGTTAGTGIQSTAHDWSATGAHPASYNGGTANAGLCTRCHTPHRAMTTELLWNHTLSTQSFHWDIPSTTAGTLFPTFPGDTYKGSTAKCLSCHDGSVAVADINWFMEGKPTTSSTFKISGAAQIATATGLLAGVHPVAMPYPYGQSANTYNYATTGAGFTANEWQPSPLAPVQLYNDDGSGNITFGGVTGKSGIECQSCHDVHNRQTVSYDYLLRGTLAGSDTNYLCLKCHIK